MMKSERINTFHQGEVIGDVLLILKTLRCSESINQNVYDLLSSRINQLPTDPYSMIIEMADQWIEVEDSSKRKFRLTVKSEQL